MLFDGVPILAYVAGVENCDISIKPKYKILVVDDDPDLSKTFALMLEYDGHEVHVVDGGLAALAILERSRFDLILTDFIMPGVQGDQLAALVKQRWPDQPIIMMSGAFGHRIEEGCPINFVDCLLNKPFTLVELRDAIVWVLDRQKIDLASSQLSSGLGTTLPSPGPATGSKDARRDF